MFECVHNVYSIKKPGIASLKPGLKNAVITVGTASVAPPGDKPAQ
ncbi:hypothetical protein BN130_1664 [Cronobacter malonaticus 507]|nr:hypothetical protein BN130_1664 [Cronobacter malonaticus 507]